MSSYTAPYIKATLTSDGGSNGLITVAATTGFLVNAKVSINATGLPALACAVYQILGPTQLLVKQLTDYKLVDVSAYTVAGSATITQPTQPYYLYTPTINDGQGNAPAIINAMPTGFEYALAVRLIGQSDITNPSVGFIGSMTPTSATLIGGSDGTNLQELLVESSSNPNLRTSIYQGAVEAPVSSTLPSGSEAGLYVRIVSQPPEAAGGTADIDESPFIAGVTEFTPSGGVFNDSLSFLSSGDNATVRITEERAFHVNLRNSTGTEIGTALSPVRVDPTGSTTQPISGTITANAGTGTFTIAGTVTANQGTSPWNDNITQFGGNNVVTGTGGSGLGIPRITVSNDSNILATQSGTWIVTANAGTNLNTSALALDTSVNGILVSQGSTTSGEKGPLIQGAVTTASPTYTNAQTSPLSLTTAGALRTDSSAVTQPVSAVSLPLPTGAATSSNQINGNQQTQIVQGGNTVTVTVSNALKVDGSAVTQPVSGTVTVNQGTSPWVVNGSSGTFPVTQSTSPWVDNITQFGGVNLSTGTGASGSGIPRVTVSNDSNILATQSGTWIVTANAGTNLNTSALALDTSVNGILLSQGSPTLGERGPLIQGAVTTSSPIYTTAQTSPLSLTTAGALRVDGSAVTQPISGTVTANAGTGNFTVVQATASNLNANVSGTVTANQGTSPWISNITQFGSNNVVTGTGASGVGIPRVTVSNDSNILATQSGIWTVQPGNTPNTTPWLFTINQGGNSATVTATNALKVDGSAVTQPISAVSLPLPTGAATSANQTTIGTQTTQINDGTRTATIKAASTAAVATDTSLVIALSPNSPTPAGSNNIGSIANITGTVSLPTGAATSANQTTLGNQTTKINDGTNTAVVKAASTIPIATDPALVVSLSPNSVQLGPVTPGTVASKSVLIGGQYNSSLPNPTTGQQVALQVDSNGRLIVTQQVASNINSPALGYITTTAITNVPIIASTYNEPTLGAQRSISSSSANDSSVGTGARSVIITWYDNAGNGPNTETVILNGTTVVNTVSTTMCFIESIVVETVGTGSSNAGTITLFNSTAGGGGTLGTMNVGDNATFWGHHYTPNGKTSYITDMTGNNSSTGNSTLLTIKAIALPVGNNVDKQVSDWFNVGGGVAQTVRNYGSPIKVVGPARIQLYGAPAGTPSILTRASFDFYDQ